MLSIYVQNLAAAGDPIQYEVPFYGSGRLGMYRPLDQANYYELKDHLGNVRVVIGGSTSVNYLATMETYRDSLESPYFERNKVVPVADHLNHTPDSLATRAIRINNALDSEVNPIGGGITLRMFPGDTLRSQVFAKYEDFDTTMNDALPALAGYFTSVFGLPAGGEGTLPVFDVVDHPSFLTLPAWSQFNDRQPRMYLNYLLYDNNFNLIDFGFDQVSSAARIPSDSTALSTHPFERLEVEVTTQQPGFVYIYVSNENQQNVTAYFDDLHVEHTYGNIAVATDRYPFGLAMAGRELERIKWRYGYQGDFAEEDEETGWNSFELRMYDAVIGRWLVPDPYGQYWSSYLGMGNSPLNGMDPDGGLFGKWRAQRYAKKHGGTAFQDDVTGRWWVERAGDLSVFAKDFGRQGFFGISFRDVTAFGAGFSNAFVTNHALGKGRLNIDDDSFLYGQFAGDLASVAAGLYETGQGIGLIEGGAIVTVGSGGSLSVAGVPTIALGVAVTAEGIATTTTAINNIYDNHGRVFAKKARSPHRIGARKRFNTRKGAYEAAKRAGDGNEPVLHPPEKGRPPHYHPGNAKGKPLNHDHYYFPKRFY